MSHWHSWYVLKVTAYCYSSLVYSKGEQTKAHRPNPAHCMFLVNLWTKNDFYLKKIKRIFHDMWNCNLILVSINKVLLEYSQMHLFTYGCFYTVSTVMWLKQKLLYMVCKAYNIWPITEVFWSLVWVSQFRYNFLSGTEISVFRVNVTSRNLQYFSF